MDVLGNFLSVFSADTGLSLAEVRLRYSNTASFLLVMIKAASCLSCASPIDHQAVRTMILRSINLALDEVRP